MHPDFPAPSLLRRMAAVAYDTLLLCGILLLSGLPLPLLPENLRDHWGGRLMIQAYLLLVCLLFFAWFWTHGGQTLGMRAWRIRVVGADGSPIDWRAAAKRFFAAALSWAPLGLGFVWALFDRNGLAWHDHLSGTRLIRLPKAPSGGPIKRRGE